MVSLWIYLFLVSTDSLGLDLYLESLVDGDIVIVVAHDDAARK